MDFVELIPTHEFLTKGHSSNNFTRDFYLSEISAILEESGINLKSFLKLFGIYLFDLFIFSKSRKTFESLAKGRRKKYSVLLKSNMKMER